MTASPWELSGAAAKRFKMCLDGRMQHQRLGRQHNIKVERKELFSQYI